MCNKNADLKYFLLQILFHGTREKPGESILVFLNSWLYWNNLEGLLNRRLLDPTPDTVGPEWGPGICASNKVPGGPDDVLWGHYFESHCCAGSVL